MGRRTPDHGTGVRYFGIIMTDLELSQRIREQKAAKRKAKLKYRGVAYNSLKKLAPSEAYNI